MHESYKLEKGPLLLLKTDYVYKHLNEKPTD